MRKTLLMALFAALAVLSQGCVGIGVAGHVLGAKFSAGVNTDRLFAPDYCTAPVVRASAGAVYYGSAPVTDNQPIPGCDGCVGH